MLSTSNSLAGEIGTVGRGPISPQSNRSLSALGTRISRRPFLTFDLVSKNKLCPRDVDNQN